MRKSFIIGALLAVALLGGVGYGYATYSNKKNPTSNEKIYSELDTKIAKAENAKDNDLNNDNEKNKERNSNENSKSEKNNSDNNHAKSNDTNSKGKNSKSELTNEEKNIIKIAEKYEGVENNQDVETLIGEKTVVNGETYYHVHMVSKKLINQGGSGTIDDFYINKHGKVLKNTDVGKIVNDNNKESKIIKLAEKHEGIEDSNDIVTVIDGTKKVNGQTYYHIHISSKNLINQGGSGTVDDFYINENGKVLKNINN